MEDINHRGMFGRCDVHQCEQSVRSKGHQLMMNHETTVKQMFEVVILPVESGARTSPIDFTSSGKFWQVNLNSTFSFFVVFLSPITYFQ